MSDDDNAEMIPTLEDVTNFDLEADRARRWIVLYPDDYDEWGRDVDGNIALKVDIEQAGEMLSLAALSIAALSNEDADDTDVIRDLITELEGMVDE